MTDEQVAAFEPLRALARPFRFRVVADAEGFPVIPGRLGRVEFHCNGLDCHGCPAPGPLLAVWTDRPRLFAKLWAPVVDLRKGRNSGQETARAERSRLPRPAEVG